MAKTIIQIPVDKTLRDQALKAARKMGFSSLQELIRVFLVQLAADNVSMSLLNK